MVEREYICPKCGVLNFKESIKDEPLKTCPSCGDSLGRNFYMPEVKWLGNFKHMKGDFRDLPDLAGNID